MESRLCVGESLIVQSRKQMGPAHNNTTPLSYHTNSDCSIVNRIRSGHVICEHEKQQEDDDGHHCTSTCKAKHLCNVGKSDGSLVPCFLQQLEFIETET